MVFVKIPGTFLREYAKSLTEARRKAVEWLQKERIESHVDVYRKRDDKMAIGYVIKQYGDVYMWVRYGPPEVHEEIYKNGKVKK